VSRHEVFRLSIVEGKNRKSGSPVDLIGKGCLRRHVVVEAVFDCIKRHQFYAGGAPKNFDRADTVAIHARRMREQADPFAPHRGKSVRLEHIDAEHDTGLRATGRTGIGGGRSRRWRRCH
jgi:hypothetical protein